MIEHFKCERIIINTIINLIKELETMSIWKITDFDTVWNSLYMHKFLSYMTAKTHPLYTH